ncbi:MAG: hypothetical protein Q8Q67_03215 [bacterium]|nr:hypothetical protein [bacterium]
MENENNRPKVGLGVMVKNSQGKSCLACGYQSTDMVPGVSRVDILNL